MARLEKLGDPYATAVTPAPVNDDTDPGARSYTDIDITRLLMPAQLPDEIGRLGVYRVLKVLGAGGMGVVFLAEDTVLKRRVALKAMKPELATSSLSRERFLREAQAAASIRHDHVVVVHQAGDESGVAYLAMELLDGESLEARLKREEKLPIPEVLRIGREIADGLAAAHEQGLIHRDIKPANIWLQAHPSPSGRGAGGEGPRVKLLDFGLARAADEDGKLTTAGAIIGTPAYMSPEQANAEPVDARTDLFSLGCVLYRMCTGQPPFAGEKSLQVLRAVVEDHPKPPREVNSEVPAELSALVMRLLEKDRIKRPESARQVATELAAIDHVPETTPMPKPAPRRPNWLPWAIAATFLLSLPGGYWVYQIVIIRDRDGNKIAEFKVPKDGKLEIIDDKKDGKGGDNKKQAIATTAPMSPVAWVTNPAAIKGVNGWTIASTRPLGPFAMASDSGGQALHIRPDDTMVAVRGWGDPGHVGIYDMKDGRVLKVIVTQFISTRVFAWSRKKGFLAILGEDGSIEVWDVPQGKRVRTFRSSAAYTEGPYLMEWSASGKLLALARGKSIVTWDPSTGTRIDRLPDVRENITSLSWGSDDKHLAAASGFGKVWVIDVADAKILHELNSNDSYMNAHQLEWSPDGSMLACSFVGRETKEKRYQPKVEVWHALSGKAHPHSNQIAKYTAASSLDPHQYLRLIWAADGKTLKGVWEAKGHWDFAEAKWARPLQDEKMLRVDPKLKSGTPIRWSSDGKIWLTPGPGGIGDPGILMAWSTETGKPIWKIDGNPDVERPSDRVKTDISSPDGKFRAIASDDDVIRVLDARTGEIFKQRAIPEATRIFSLSWSTDNRRLHVARPNNETGHLYDMYADSLIRIPGGHSQAWSKGWKYYAARNTPAKKILILNGATQAEVAKLEDEDLLYPNTSGPLAFSPDEMVLAVGGKKGLRLYDINAKKWSNAFDGVGIVWSSLAWSPDAKKMLAINKNHKLSVWDIASEKQLYEFDEAPGAPGNFIGWDLGWSTDAAKGTATFRGESTQTFHWNAASGKFLRRDDDAKSPKLKCVPLPNEQFIAISPEGHYRGTPNAARHIVYIVETERGQETLTPAEMEKKYGWKNDPDKVRLTR